MAEKHLFQPTFIYDFPTEISPLSKCRADDPSLTERFELFIAGMEIANGFSELNDPADQERRFRAQVEKGGQEMPKEVDTDYIRALSHGLPPTAGRGHRNRPAGNAAHRFSRHSRSDSVSSLRCSEPSRRSEAAVAHDPIRSGETK